MKTFLQQRLTAELAGVGLPFLAFGIALNLTTTQISSALKLPLYLDSIGTVLVAVLCGPWSAIVAGSFSNLLGAAFGIPQMAFFIPVVMSIGAFSAFLARKGWFKRVHLVLAGGILQGLIAALISAPIAAYVFGGVMLSGTDVLVLYFRSVGNTLLQSVLMQGMVSDPLDKVVTYLIVYVILRGLPLRLLHRFSGASNVATVTTPTDRDVTPRR